MKWCTKIKSSPTKMCIPSSRSTDTENDQKMMLMMMKMSLEHLKLFPERKQKRSLSGHEQFHSFCHICTLFFLFFLKKKQIDKMYWSSLIFFPKKCFDNDIILASLKFSSEFPFLFYRLWETGPHRILRDLQHNRIICNISLLLHDVLM